MGSLSKCHGWSCRHKKPVKCAEIEVEIDIEEYDGIVCINLCHQCLTDALEVFE